MRRACHRLTTLVIAGLPFAAASISAAEQELRPPEERARETFTKAAASAEATYRSSVRDILSVLESLLTDDERAAVRQGEVDRANLLRNYRDRIARLRTVVSRRVFLGGTLPPINDHLVPPSAKQRVEEYAQQLSAAAKTYRAALDVSKSEVMKLIASARRLAIDTADLDAANRVQNVENGILNEIALRSEVLGYNEYSCKSMVSARKTFLLAHPEGWRVVDGELIGTERLGEVLEATLAWKFQRIASVTVRGRIRRNSKHNFRMSVGPVNLIFNWELARQCHFRYNDDRTILQGDLLKPGQEHEITVQQLTPKTIEVLVDGKRVWATHGRLFGTVTIYPSISSIGIRNVRILGNASGALDPSTGRPSHRRW